MDILEKELEGLFYHALLDDNALLYERGLGLHGKPDIVKKQLHIGKYGRADIVTFERALWNPYRKRFEERPRIKIFEFKKGEINVDTLIQACTYLAGIKDWIDKNDRSMLIKPQYDIILVGKSIDKGNWIFLSHLDDFSDTSIAVYKYSYRIDGLWLDEEHLQDYYKVDAFEQTTQ
jgi:hypothetical protein